MAIMKGLVAAPKFVALDAKLLMLMLLLFSFNFGELLITH